MNNKFNTCLITKIKKYSKVIRTVDGIDIHLFDTKCKAVSMVTDTLQNISWPYPFHNVVRLYSDESSFHFEAKKRCFSIKDITLTRKNKERWIDTLELYKQGGMKTND